MDRRLLLKGIASTGVGLLSPLTSAQTLPTNQWAKTWHAALAVLTGNLGIPPEFDAPVLFEAPKFQGIWLECGPHESFAFAQLSEHIKVETGRPTPLDIAKNSHQVFFRNQRPDGQFPAYLNHRSGVNFAQIQMVVPIAATAWETAKASQDSAFLLEAYAACGRWDEWLSTYRDTRKTGLIEAFVHLIRVKTTVRDGWAFRMTVLVVMLKIARLINRCRAYARIYRQLFLVDVWRLAKWHWRSARNPRRGSGEWLRNEFAS